MSEKQLINYVEFPAFDLDATKAFFTEVFGWSFQDYGPEYTAFYDAGLDGGFYKSDKRSTTDAGGALIVFYSEDLEASLEKVKAAGGKIRLDIFSFPGGRRYQFLEPSGNEFGVWSDKGM